MKKRIISMVVVVILVFLMSGLGEIISDIVESKINSIHVELNGTVIEGDNLLYEATIYRAQKTMTDIINGTVKWFSNPTSIYESINIQKKR